jgi:hypothetical protein
MLWLVLALSVPFQAAPPAPPGSAGSPGSIDVSTLKVGAATTVVELDLGKLKGELRQLAWSPDAQRFYIQTAEGHQQSPKLRHYWVAVEGGAVLGVDAQPDWANAYWAFKSDRSAPGMGWVMIDVEQTIEKKKVGTGSGRPGEMAGGAGNSIPVDIEKTAEGQHQNVVRLTLFGETVSEFVNQQALPGLTFGWGPEKSGAIAFTDLDGRLILLDQKKHKHTVAGAKDALLPAWTVDGHHLAWVQKSGRRKYTLVYADVSR